MPIKYPFRVIGIMSGTSLDGIDLALVEFNKKEQAYRFEIIKAVTVKYEGEMFSLLRNSRNLNNDELIQLHNNWGTLVGNQILEYFGEYLPSVQLISSHGHTVFHEPRKGFTLQIGSLEKIRSIVNKTVVGDFRSLDVSKGGEGAPLVPIGDELLFNEYDYCLNLGGIANVSFQDDGQRMAFDLAPCNLIFNYLAEKLGYDYDESGKIGQQGELNTHLYQQLMSHQLYNGRDKPSLGIEYIASEFYPLFDDSGLSVQDQLNTGYLHLAAVIRKICGTTKTVLLTGGGAHNSFLLECMGREGVNFVVPSKEIIDFKEALIFAFLGLRRVEEKVNVLASVTGASSDSCAGQVFLT